MLERLELESGFELGLVFGPKINRLKPLLQTVKNSLVMAKVSEITRKYVVWPQKNGIPVFLKMKTLSCVKAAW